MVNFKRLALVPARSGSKGIPKKNLQVVGERTLLQRAIDAANRCGLFSEVCVSTDSDEIAELALTYGASVPFMRPANISGDSALGIEVVKHALNYYLGKGEYFSSITLLQPTTPFRDSEDVYKAITLFEDSSFESLISIFDVTHMQPSTLYQIDGFTNESGLIGLKSFDPADSSSQGTLRQNFSPLYWRNGSIYIFKPENILSSTTLLKSPVGGFPMSWVNSINVDNPKDLEFARLISERFNI